MRIGPLEIILILIVVMLVLLAVRVVRGDRPALVKDKNSSLGIPERQVAESIGGGHKLTLTGIVFIIVAVLLVLSGMSLFKWVMKMYLWSFLFLAVGLAILFVSRKR